MNLVGAFWRFSVASFLAHLVVAVLALMGVVQPTYEIDTLTGALLISSIAFVYPVYRAFTQQLPEFSLLRFVECAPMYVKLLFAFSTTTMIVGFCISMFGNPGLKGHAVSPNWDLVAKLGGASDVLLVATVLRRARDEFAPPNNTLQRMGAR